MYSPLIIDQTLHTLRKQGHKAPTTPYAESLERSALLARIYDAERGVLRRDLTEAEVKWVAGETLRCSVDFRYCASRYFRIKGEVPGALPLWDKPWESQEIILSYMAKLQESEQERRDGILLANLKSRQLGASTVYELVMTHRAIFTQGFTALLAADVPEQSEYLFNMMERAYEHLPWWLKPHREYHVKGAQMWFDQLDSLVVVNHGNRPSGDVGRGKTSHATHLSELETWQDTTQIQDGLLPAIPRKPGIMVFFESTGQYNVSWWHDFFMGVLNRTGGIAGIDRFSPVFIPWYAEPTKYSSPAPADWRPDAIAQKHAEACERDSPRWCGRRVTLTRDQLFWWQTTRNSAASAPDPHALGFFFCNYASSPEEAFRSVNVSVFSYELMEELRAGTSHPKVWEVAGPHIDRPEIRAAQLATVGVRKTT